ncbi:uncharacterized protein LOC127118041 isoform X2 [Lathyrus oleraceus]|uniref:Uncharacterized protein n=1 Tax=Pisum sativum TaxID=3888 RepID=A0A9D5B4P5_PEA|nr:uncharacterized protein LOC127118041 isoform X2 [Pisum sativum]KAI5433793.1 hypothetical protein KIW84_020886 [Pisum sativum]
MATLSLLHNLNFVPLFNPSLSHQNPISSISLKPSILRCSNSTNVPAPSPSPSIRIQRCTRIHAQCALFDYLHYTRRYTLVDADFIAKNSPCFINSLISKVRVNERDDDFGWAIRRNRMGKIYKEAREVFGYGSGVLSKKFESYESLGLSKSSLVQLFVCCPLLLVGDEVDSQFVVVLDWLKRIGIETGWFVSCMSPKRTYRWKTIIDSIELFHQGGYSEKQMYDLFKADPKLLLEGLGKKAFLVIGRLIKLGLGVNEICSCFREHPDMLSSPRMENLMLVIAFLYNIRMEQDAIAHVLYNHMHILNRHSIKGYKTVSKELGVGKASLCQMIQDDPLEFFGLALRRRQKKNLNDFKYDPRRYLEKTNFLRKLGYTDNTEEMEIAMKMFGGRGDKLLERFNCLVEAGLEYNTVVEMVKQIPAILIVRKTALQKKIDFLKNTLGYPIECLVGYPKYLFRDLDTIYARFAMYEWLKKRNARIDCELCLSTIVSTSEKQFLKLIVNAHPEGPTAWQIINSLYNKSKN